MDKLTWEYKDGGMFVDGKEVEMLEYDGVEICTGNAISKLAEYENTNLEPGEVSALKEKQVAKEPHTCSSYCPSCGTIVMIRHPLACYCEFCGQKLDLKMYWKRQ
jgi:hypothetical protein